MSPKESQVTRSPVGRQDGDEKHPLNSFTNSDALPKEESAGMGGYKVCNTVLSIRKIMI